MHRANIQMDCDRVSEKCMLVKKEVLEPVSYTHLDVYKRQNLQFPIDEQPDLKVVEKTMKENPDIAVVYTTHNETGTGVGLSLIHI